MTSRNYVFTVNNYEEGWYPRSNKIKLCIWQFEIGEQGTPHAQGYVELHESMRMAAVKKIPCFARAHLSKRGGTRYQAADYCIKERTRISGPYIEGYSGTPEEFVRSLEKTPKNHAAELEAIKRMLDEGKTSLEIAESNFSQWVRHHRAFSTYQMLKTQPRSEIENVIVVYGPTGTGKSRFCMDQYPTAYWKSRGQWWDGYAQQQHVVIDEYYGWLPWDMLLRLCDRYPLLLETKGGTCQFTGTSIILTTNKDPKHWYDEAKGMKFETFARRVTQWIYMPTQNDHQLYTQHHLFNAAIQSTPHSTSFCTEASMEAQISFGITYGNDRNTEGSSIQEQAQDNAFQIISQTQDISTCES